MTKGFVTMDSATSGSATSGSATSGSATLVRSSRLGVLALTAALAFAACSSDTGGSAISDEQVSDSAAATESTVDATDTDTDTGTDVESTADAPAGLAVLETSASLTTTGAALAPFDDTSIDATVGTAAPIITGQQFDGTDITIGGPTDGPTMLVFLAHWCPHCNDEIPELVTLRDSGEFPDDLNIIGISTAVDDSSDNYPPSEWMVEKDFTWPVLADTMDVEAFGTYGGSGFPFTVMLDAEGNVLARKSGNEPADKINAWIDTVLNA